MQRLPLKPVCTMIVLLITAGCDAPTGDPERQLEQTHSVENGESGAGQSSKTPSPEEFERFSLSQQDYAVPKSHVRSIRRGGAESFERIKHPDHPIELVFDGKSNGSTDQSGAPRIFSINDGDYPGLTYRSGDGETIVCRGADSARAGCGTKLSHGAASWSVLFPISKVDEASQLTQQARNLLDRYSSDTEVPSQEARAE